MTTTKHLGYLRYFGAACLCVLGCTAESGDPTGPAPAPQEQGGGDDEVAQKEEALQGGSIVGRWRFNELEGQVVRGRFGMNNGFLGSTPFVDDNDPFRSALNYPREDSTIGRSLYFDGMMDEGEPVDFVTVPSTREDFALLQPAKVSVSVWMRAGASQKPTSLGYLVSKGVDTLTGNCSAASYYLYVDSAGLARFGVTTTANTYRESAAASGLYDLQWHHLVGTFDGVTARIYKDGVLVGGGATGPNLNVGYMEGKSRNLHFGAYNGAGDSCKLGFTGRLDDVRIYNGALTAGDVAQVFGGPVSLPDADGDGVTDTLDRCPNTPSSTAVSTRGCSCAQITTAAGAQCPTVAPISNPDFCYRNHGAYVSCVSNEVLRLAPEGGEIFECAEDIISAASQSKYGRDLGDPTTLRCEED